MLDQISDLDEAELCELVLSVMMTGYLPITFEELASFSDYLKNS